MASPFVVMAQDYLQAGPADPGRHRTKDRKETTDLTGITGRDRTVQEADLCQDRRCPEPMNAETSFDVLCDVLTCSLSGIIRPARCALQQSAEANFT